MIKRISKLQRNKLRNIKEEKNRLDKLIKLLIAKGILTQEDLK